MPLQAAGLNALTADDQIPVAPIDETTKPTITLISEDAGFDLNTDDRTILADGTTQKHGKRFSVTVNFADAVSDGKTLTISVPEGLEFVNITVPGDSSKYNYLNGSYLNKLGNEDTLSTNITKVTLPSLRATYGTALFGDVVYEFTSGTETVTIDFILKLDESIYYAPNTMPISIKATKGVVEETIQQTISLEGALATITGELSNSDNFVHGSGGSKQISQGKSDYLTSVEFTNVSADFTGPLYFENFVFDLYYPAEVTFTGNVRMGSNGTDVNIFEADYLSKLQAIYPTITSAIHDAASNKVTFTFANMNGATLYRPNFTIEVNVPQDLTAATYTANTATLTATPKGSTTPITISAKQPAYVEVMESLKVANYLQINSATSTAVGDYATQSLNAHQYYSYAGFATVTSGSELVDGVSQKPVPNEVHGTYSLEINYDANFKASTVAIPFDKDNQTAADVKIWFKTNTQNSDWVQYTGTQTQSAYLIYITSDMANLADDEYFTDIKADIGDVAKIDMYKSGGDNTTNFWVYGIVADSSVSQVVHTIKYWPTGYGEGDAQNLTETATMTASYVADNSAFAYSGGRTDCINVSSGGFAGDTFTVKTTIELNGKIANRSTLENPIIYVKQEKDITINNIVLSVTGGQQLVLGKDYTIETLTVGEDTVYKISTINQVISVGMDEARTSHSLQLNFDYTTDITKILTDTKFEPSKIIAWTSENNVVQPHANSAKHSETSYAFDINQDGTQSDLFAPVISNGTTIKAPDSVILTSKLNLDTNGVLNTVPNYNGDQSTVATFYNDTTAVWEMTVINYSPYDLSSDGGSKFIIYLPLPKDGLNFGANYQTGEFTWDILLNGDVVANNFTVEYAAADASNVLTTSYSATPTEQSNMIRLTLNSGVTIYPNDVVTLQVPIKTTNLVDFKDGGNINILNPYYYIKNVDTKGTTI